MAVVYVFEGKERTLEVILSTLGNWSLRLFQNNVTPDNDTVLAALDVADFSGYSDFSVTWGGVVEDANGNAAATALVAEFIHSGGATANDIYGWYLVMQVGGTEKLTYCERFSDAPRVMEFVDDEIDITPQMIQGACPP